MCTVYVPNHFLEHFWTTHSVSDLQFMKCMGILVLQSACITKSETVLSKSSVYIHSSCFIFNVILADYMSKHRICIIILALFNFYC